MEDKPDLIVPTAKRRATPRFSGDDLTQWAWTEPSVWTNPMLATLEHNRVRGGKWHSLIDKVYQPDNLYSAYREVAANQGAPGVDNITIEDFTAGLSRNLDKLEQHLRDGTYRPQAIKRVRILKPGTNETRPLGIPTVRDRRPTRSVCARQNSLRHVLEPILERQFAATNAIASVPGYGFRPTRGCKDRVPSGWRRVDRLVKDG